MADQSVSSNRIRPSGWRIPLLALGFVAVGGLTHLAPNESTSFHHLFYIIILAAASFYGVFGGIVLAVVSTIVSSPLLPSLNLQSPPQTMNEIILRFLGFVGVGVVTGMWSNFARKRMQELDRMTDDSINAFVRALDAVDRATAVHSQKVAEYATAIAQEMNLPPAQINKIRWAALLHDVGKLSIPSEVLNKREPLTDAEWEVVKRHPIESVRIVGDVSRLQPLLPAMRHHHERLDGRGYPDGVQGDRFPLEARIISVADAFDAMTSNRAYRPALSTVDAYAELRRHAGTQFDPQVVSAFISHHSQKHHTNGLGDSMSSGTTSPVRCESTT